MTLQEFYAQIGGSYADTVRRLCSESFVLHFVKKYPANPSFDELCEAVGRSDWETAFRAAHTLKGVTGNLSMTRLYTLLVGLTDALRGEGDMAAARAQYPAVKEAYDAVVCFIGAQG